MKLSIVIPTYNYAQFLTRCLDSVMRQDTPGHEVLIVDDGSTDDTAAVVARLHDRYAPQPIVYVHQQNAGPSAARNKGVMHASGDYVWFLDADDALVQGAFQRFQEALAQNPDGVLFFSGYDSINLKNERIAHPASIVDNDRTANFRRCVMGRIGGLTIGSAAVKTSVCREIQFPVGVHNNEDVVLFSHLLACYPAVAVPGIVVVKYRHAGSLRRNLDRIEETGLDLVDHLFDPQRLNLEQMKLRKRFLAKRCLSISRTCYLHGEYRKTRAYYHRAIREYPWSIFKGSNLRKYIRSYLKSGF